MIKGVSLLKNVVSDRKRKVEENKKLAGTKYFKLGEIEKVRIDKYIKEQGVIEEKKKEKEKEKEEEIASRFKENVSQEKELPPLSEAEVKKRLIARGEPITLFGETAQDRENRLRQIELREPLEFIEGNELVGSDFIKAIKKENEKCDDDIEVIKKRKAEEEDPDFRIEEREPDGIEEEVLFYFRKLLVMKQKQLDDRSEDDKKSQKGRKDMVTFQQTKSNIRPFFKQCRKKTVPGDIIKEVANIVTALKEFDYVKANDSFFKMSIGNSPWPMGVTMVGIHERSAREKISSSETAHVLNDDTQRKYIHAIKRLMSFHQKLYPTVPSKSVM